MNKERIKALQNEVRIQIDDSQYEEIENELCKMECIAKAFSKVDTGNVEPMVRCFETEAVFRKEDSIYTLTKEEALINANSTKDGYIEISRVVK